MHRPGKTNHAADAASRHPSPSGSVNMHDAVESALLASICSDARELGAITWPLLARETGADASLGHLLKLIEQGVSLDSTDPTLASLWPTCKAFYEHEGVLLYQDRVVVPIR